MAAIHLEFFKIALIENILFSVYVSCQEELDVTQLRFSVPNLTRLSLLSLPPTDSFFGPQSYNVSILGRVTTEAIDYLYLQQSHEAPLSTGRAHRSCGTEVLECTWEHWTVELNGGWNLMNIMK